MTYLHDDQQDFPLSSKGYSWCKQFDKSLFPQEI
jgi:hypothetical protein